jgi:hypothetical protein
MSGYRTADAAKLDYIKFMGEPLGKLFYALWQEVAWLYSKWAEYVELFGTKPSRINLLNEAAPLFFRIVQDSLWEDTILHIARLTDPHKSVGKENLTIQAIPYLVSDRDIAQTIFNLIEVAIRTSEFCRDWRNRRIAHRDLKLAIEEGITPLKPASHEKVKQALNSIAEVLNAVSEYYTGSTTVFDIGGYSRGAMSLLYVLHEGVTAREERLERIKRGEIRKGDFEPRNL